MEFTTNQHNMQLLNLWRGDSRLGSAPTDISAKNIADWIQRIPPPNKQSQKSASA
jgi:hypothetical protein